MIIHLVWLLSAPQMIFRCFLAGSSLCSQESVKRFAEPEVSLCSLEQVSRDSCSYENASSDVASVFMVQSSLIVARSSQARSGSLLELGRSMWAAIDGKLRTIHIFLLLCSIDPKVLS